MKIFTLKTIPVLLFALGIMMTNCTSRPQAVASEVEFPAFSWDSLNVCLHFSKSGDDFTSEELDFISQFPLICIEKTQATKKHKGADKGAEVAAVQIKEHNPNAKVLAYLNLKMDYGDLYSFGSYTQDGGLHTDWRLTDLKGVDTKTSTRYMYDLSNEEFQQWWVNTAVEFANLEGMDGLFIDAITTNILFPERKAKTYGEEKYEAIRKGFYTIMDGVKENILGKKIVLGNGIKADTSRLKDNGLHLFEYLDGAMTEHFADLSGKNKDAISASIELIHQVAQMNKIYVVKGWPRYNFTNEELRSRQFTQEQLEDIAREDIVFPLACFLCGAGKYSYFCYSWGYRDIDGGMIDYPEYHKPLGEPLGKYERDGYVFTRKFEHASVWVDVEKREAKIDWAE